MQATSNFTRGKEPLDDIPVAIENLSLRRNVDSTHRVVDSWGNVDGKEARLGDAPVHPSRPVELGVIMVFHGLVPGRNRLLQGCRIHVQLLSQILNRITMNNQTYFVVELNGLGPVTDALVENQVSTVLWQGCDGVGNDLPGIQLIHEPLPVCVNQDSPFTTNSFPNQVDMGVVLLNGWVNLNQVHLHQLSTNTFGQFQAVTGSPRLVGRLVVLEVGAEAFDVFLRSTEAPGCQNHCLGTDLLRKVARLDFNAVNPAFRVL